MALLLGAAALFLLGLAAVGVPARPSLTRVLFIYGSVPPGTSDIEMVRITNTVQNGYSQLAEMLHAEQGHNVTEVHDTDPSVNPLTTLGLARYDLIVLGSNNRRFSKAEAAVIGSYVSAGGALLAFSDAQFGPLDPCSANGYGAGDLSDNDLLAQFGMAINHDNFRIVEADSTRFTDPTHPILRGIGRFKGEGVSLVRVNGAPAQVLVRGDNLQFCDGQPTTSNHAVTAIAQVGRGRVAATFDRNTFFNAGVGSAGTDLDEYDNRDYARNLFNWLARPGAPSLDGDRGSGARGR